MLQFIRKISLKYCEFLQIIIEILKKICKMS